MSAIRFAILCAVSSEAQAAEDKFSLAVQEQRSREAARQRGWNETAGPFRIPGESRTKYVNLSHAEAAMPDLKRMLDDAREHKFDVLAMYDYDRLRDLLGLVSKSLAHYHVQMFAVNLPVEPIAPSEYNPYKNDMAIMMETFAMMKQRAQTNDLRRKYAEAMPRRASQRGLPVKAPYGYHKPVSSKVPPELDSELVPYVLKMKDLFLAGKSTTDIADWMNTTGLKPQGRTWYPQTIKQILTNPFYAGIVRWGATRSELDPRTGRVRRNKNVDVSQISIGVGVHVPLWDKYTHEELLAEFTRRGKSYNGKSNQVLSGLLTCGICGQRLWAFYNNNTSGADNLVWRCSSRQAHVVIRNPEALRKVCEQIARDIDRVIHTPHMEMEESEASARENMEILKAQRDRLVHAYTIGLLSIDEFSAQKTGADVDIRTLSHKLETYTRAERAARDREIVLQTVHDNLGSLPEWISGPHADINYALRKIIADVLVEENNEITLTWK